MCVGLEHHELQDQLAKYQKDVEDLVSENESLMKTITTMNIEHKEQVGR